MKKVAALVGESKNVNENSGFDGKKAANLTTDAASLLISSNLFTNEEGPLRCYQFQQILSSLVGPRGVGFDMPTYLSAQYSNDSLFASAYLMVSSLLFIINDIIFIIIYYYLNYYYYYFFIIYYLLVDCKRVFYFMIFLNCFFNCFLFSEFTKCARKEEVSERIN